MYLVILELDYYGFYRQTRVISKLSKVSKEANVMRSRVAEMGVLLEIRRHHLETDLGPIAMVNRVELFIHKPCQRNAN